MLCGDVRFVVSIVFWCGWYGFGRFMVMCSGGWMNILKDISVLIGLLGRVMIGVFVICLMFWGILGCIVILMNLILWLFFW